MCLESTSSYQAGKLSIYIQIDEWVNRYGTNIFVVDEITGRMYAEVGGKLHSIPEIASNWCQEEPVQMPKTDEQDQTSVRERALGEELVRQTPTTVKCTGTVPPCIAEMNPSVVGGSWGIAHMGIDTRGTTMECRDRDSQIIGIVRPVVSQPPTPHDLEEI